MIHVWDHFDYTGDLDWLRRQGYPLLKATAEYWLDALQEDIHSHDGSLVVAPCNSPELPQITFGMLGCCVEQFSLTHETGQDVLIGSR
jgi:alpha-L-fucosidase 2